MQDATHQSSRPRKTTVRNYGWIRELPDQRDIPFNASLSPNEALPPRISLRSGMPPVYDQGQLGSCTANALAAQLDYTRHRQGEQFIAPSRLFIYYNERAMEGTVASDAGAMGRDGIKSLKTQGVCPETEWPYIIRRFAERPQPRAFADAIQFESLTYARIDHTVLSDIKSALAEELPVSFGFTVYESFESDQVAKTGIVPMPTKSEAAVGGHEVLIIGYDDSKQMVEVRNSWGPSWGDAGYFWMPYAYVTGKLCSDFWVIDKVK